jgi:hypothetical protein
LLGYSYSVPNIEKVAVSCVYGMNSQMALTGICVNVIRAGIAQSSNWLDGCSSFPGWGKRFFLLFHGIQTSSGAHPSSYSTGTGDFFLRGKVAQA